jgi:hypothetical protein
MLQAYFVHIDIPEYGFAVIATSKEEAKKFAFTRIMDVKQKGGFVDPHVWYYGLHINDLNANIITSADITDMPKGPVQCDKNSLLRGIYDHTGLQECDLCEETAKLFRDPKLFNGHSINAVCAKCYNERTGAV